MCWFSSLMVVASAVVEFWPEKSKGAVCIRCLGIQEIVQRFIGNAMKQLIK